MWRSKYIHHFDRLSLHWVLSIIRHRNTYNAFLHLHDAQSTSRSPNIHTTTPMGNGCHDCFVLGLLPAAHRFLFFSQPVLMKTCIESHWRSRKFSPTSFREQEAQSATGKSQASIDGGRPTMSTLGQQQTKRGRHWSAKSALNCS